MFQAWHDDAVGRLPESTPVDALPSGTVELIELARAGDREAFTRLFQRYNQQICTYLGRLVGNSELGRDLAQETFLHAWKSLPALRSDLSFKPWLYRVATNLARSHLRHEKLIRWFPWAAHGEEEALEHLIVAGPEKQTGDSVCIQSALAQVSPQNRICLLLQLVGGFSQREIAESLGISEKSVSAYVSRGKEQFRKAYQRLDGGSVI
jgi:RNA polymerase sigma-70 factor (ECF subfamily)